VGVPVEDERGAGIDVERLTLRALAVGVEDDPARARVEAAADDHTRRRATVGVDGGQRHRVRVADVGERLVQPARQERQRIVGQIGRQGRLGNRQ
jgi:hypothetical protein